MVKYKKLDRRTKYKINAIKDALLTLINQKTFYKITITQICRVANINRSTFYLHFSSITDLLNKVIDDALLLSCTSSNMDRKEYLKGNESLLPACQRIGYSPKYRQLLMDPDLSEYIIGRIKKHEYKYVVPQIIKKTNLSEDIAKSLFIYMLYGSFAVNRAHHFLKNRNWQRDMEALNQFTNAGYNSFNNRGDKVD